MDMHTENGIKGRREGREKEPRRNERAKCEMQKKGKHRNCYHRNKHDEQLSIP